MERKLSQRTLVRVSEVLTEHTQQGNDGLDEFDPSMERMSAFLYENDFPDWFVNRARELEFKWLKILMNLRNGTFFNSGNRWNSRPITGDYFSFPEESLILGEQLIHQLAAVATTLSEAVARSLELDGFRVNPGKPGLVPIDSVVSEQQEEDRLTALVTDTGITNAAVIRTHLREADDLFVQGKDHPSVNESRSLFQAVIDSISGETNTSGGHSRGYPSDMKGRLEYLQAVGFFTSDERTAFGSAWGFLSAGSHPGLPSRDEARIALVLALEFCQLLLLKFENWKANGCRRFTR